MKPAKFIPLICLAVTVTGCLSLHSPSAINEADIKAIQDKPVAVGLGGRVAFIDLSEDGSALLVGGEDGVALYAASTLDQQWQSKLKGFGHGAFNDGSSIALVELISDYDLVVFVDPASGAIRDGLDLSPYPTMTSVAFSPQGGLLAIGFWSGPVMVWDIERQKRTHLWLDHVKNRQCGAQHTMVEWSSDGKYLAAGGWYTDALIWDVQTGKLVHQLTTDFEISNIAISPDDEYVAANSMNNDVAIWKMADGQFVAGWQVEEPSYEASGGPIHGLEWSPDGAYLAVATDVGAVTIWEVSSLSLVTELRPPDFPSAGIAVNSIKWSIDGDKLYTGAYAERVLVWDWRAGEIIGVLEAESLP